MNPRSQGALDSWLQTACEDAERRGLPLLKPLLEALARSTAALREADRAVHDSGLLPGILEGDAGSPRTPAADTTE
jgi:hypothetical protein